VVIHEKFNETLLALQSNIGFNTTSYVKDLDNSKNKKRVSESERRQIVNYNMLDLELYEVAKKENAKYLEQHATVIELV
jgi:hypothetical protein